MKYFFILGNWKEDKTLAETKVWVDAVLPKIHGVTKCVPAICPPFPLLPFFKQAIESSPLLLGAQDVSSYEKGTYTGEVSAYLLADFVTYAIVGHSERRKTFRETNDTVAQKAKLALKYGITPIVCIADTVDEQGIPVAGDSFNEVNFTAQITSVYTQLTGEEQKKIIFSFEPPTAISTQTLAGVQGTAASLSNVEGIISKVKTLTNNNLVLYGGSVKSANVLEYFKSPLIDGVMPGSASLDPEEFVRLVLTVDEANQ